MSDRTEATANASRWAEAAERHAEIYLGTRSEDELVVALAAAELGKHAREMALMWATVAALHPTEPDPSWGRKFFLNDGGTVDAGPLLSERVAAEQHGLCTASITPPEGRVGGGVTERCVLAAGHYRPNFDAKDGPHRNRLDPDDTSDVAITWVDWADGAVPHAAQPEGSSGTAPS